MFNKKTIRDIDVEGLTVLVRVDYNVPLNNGTITDDLRMKASLPTLKYLLDHGAKKLVLISHLGRPEGRKVPEFSLKPVADHLQELLPDYPVHFIADFESASVGTKKIFAESSVSDEKLEGNQNILLLENLRFYPGEEENSSDFIEKIVNFADADVFVQDGFAVVHRAHASTKAITDILPSVAGLLVEREVATLSKVIASPEHPLLVIIGGSKIDDKKPLVEKFLPIADSIVVGGKIAADGYESDDEKIYVAEDFKMNDRGEKRDIGDISVEKILELAKSAKTIIWNGVLGEVENPDFEKSSTIVAENIGRWCDKTTVICGGDTTGFVENLRKSAPELDYTLISTGGGASLELLSGLALPGIEALEDK